MKHTISTLIQYLRHLSAFVTPIHAGVWQIWQLKIRTGFREPVFVDAILIQKPSLCQYFYQKHLILIVRMDYFWQISDKFIGEGIVIIIVFSLLVLGVLDFNDTNIVQALLQQDQIFIDSGQSLGVGSSFAGGLGDLDGDGDLDAFVANCCGEANKVWLNNGSGTFIDSGQSIGTATSESIRLGDVDGDSDLDAIVGNWHSDDTIEVWLNNGAATFSNSGQTFNNISGGTVEIGDVDGDGDLDILTGNSDAQITVWLNNSAGSFSNSGQKLSNVSVREIRLHDIDKDSDLDAIFAYRNTIEIWLNNGAGGFSNSGHSLNTDTVGDIALADLNADDNIDLFVAHYGAANTVWLNNGAGVFSNSGQTLGSSNASGVALADVDNDKDIDAFIVSYGGAGEVWVNNGASVFQSKEQLSGTPSSMDVKLGDVDGDGDFDAIVFNDVGDNTGNTVWFNQSPPPPNHSPNTPFNPVPVNQAERILTNQTLSWSGGDEDGDVVTYTVAFGTINPPPVVLITTATSYKSTLITDTTYFWGITSTDGLSVSVGSTWVFTTTDIEYKVYLPAILK